MADKLYAASVVSRATASSMSMCCTLFAVNPLLSSDIIATLVCTLAGLSCLLLPLQS